jgi:hypothetical protein
MRVLSAAILVALSFANAQVPANMPQEGLLLFADFNNGPDAVSAKGDKRLYSAASYKEQAGAQPGLGKTGVVLAAGQGRSGAALHFPKKNTQAIFFAGKGNLAPANGTISFWLRLDPETDLEPGYCDPIQFTAYSFDDSAIWVDFTKDEKPRHFRLGVFGEKKQWNPADVAADKNPAFLNRLVVERKYPFAKDRWTNVAITYQNLGSANGQASLYLNGKLVGSASKISEKFDWNPEKLALRLGVNYVGYFDDLATYDRVLTAAELERLARNQ